MIDEIIQKTSISSLIFMVVGFILMMLSLQVAGGYFLLTGVVLGAICCIAFVIDGILYLRS